jgi:hypothetical protein
MIRHRGIASSNATTAVSPRTATSLRRLTNLVDSFVATAGDASFSDVRALQRAPHGSLGYGACGVISVLLHRGARARRKPALGIARRWMKEIGASRSRSLLSTPDSGDRYNRTSLWFGAPGLRYMRALAALADPRRADAARAIRAFTEQLSVVPGTERVPDLVLGAAGNLVAVNLLTAVGQRSAALELQGEALADQVAASIWAHEASWSFAHGWPGMAFALLQRAQVVGRSVPDPLVRRLRSLASRDAAERSSPGTAMRYSWCNGAAGRILLWVKAFELTGDRMFLARARADAAVIPEHGDRALHTLCCGTAGWAYGLLALDRADRGRGWYERAVRLCVEIVDLDPGFGHPSGLLKGYSGVVYLANDLAADPSRRGFPFVEALPIGRCP